MKKVGETAATIDDGKADGKFVVVGAVAIGLCTGEDVGRGSGDGAGRLSVKTTLDAGVGVALGCCGCCCGAVFVFEIITRGFDVGETLVS